MLSTQLTRHCIAILIFGPHNIKIKCSDTQNIQNIIGNRVPKSSENPAAHLGRLQRFEINTETDEVFMQSTNEGLLPPDRKEF
jgi:hypothetical protein